MKDFPEVRDAAEFAPAQGRSGGRLGAPALISARLVRRLARRWRPTVITPSVPWLLTRTKARTNRAPSTSLRRGIPAKLCTPLGACLVFRGVEGCIPFLHGSQGCSTYIRRYLISHFREPIDIASSNFHEESAVFGGKSNFQQGVRNVLRQYQPRLVGVATTCLAETIGENLPQLLHDLRGEPDMAVAPPIVHVSTASYRGTHIDGFHSAVRALVEQLAEGGAPVAGVNLFPGMVSAADLRHLKEILADFGLSGALLPDYSETMDGVTWNEYEKLQAGGTSLADIAAMGRGRASIEFGRVLESTPTAGQALAAKFQIQRHLLGLPIGVSETDAFFGLLATLADAPLPRKGHFTFRTRFKFCRHRRQHRGWKDSRCAHCGRDFEPRRCSRPGSCPRSRHPGSGGKRAGRARRA